VFLGILLLFFQTGMVSLALSDGMVFTPVCFVCAAESDTHTVPALFNLLIDAVIVSLTENGVGCWVKQTFVGCIL